MDEQQHDYLIYVVDDDPTARMIAAAILEQPGLVVREFSDAPAMLATFDDFNANPPDLILLDIEMPGMDGIAACRALRDAGNDTTQVMFVSAHNNLETRLTAYDVGGDDFIVKPYEPEELARKIGVARACAARRHALGVQMRYAQQTAFTAMSSMAEMGTVLEFLRASFSCDTPDMLAARLFDALRQYGLDGLARLRCDQTWHSFACHGECTPLECSILEHAAAMERIFQFRNRLTINYPNITLITHPLPLNDPERVGRLRDHLAVLAEGADTHLAALESMRRQRAQSSGIGEAIAELTATLAEVDRQQAEHRLRAAAIDEAYLEELIAAFVHLGLTEDQERALADMAEHTHQQLAALRDESSNVSGRLLDVAHKLNRLISQ